MPTRPTKEALKDRPVSPAAAKIGASVDTEPSISPSSAGWTAEGQTLAGYRPML
jgi:hypothetical protein